MQDIALYRQLLRLNTPWTVSRVEPKVKEQRVEVWAGRAGSARWPCPECATDVALCDHAEERTWRYLDICEFPTYLHARPPVNGCVSGFIDPHRRITPGVRPRDRHGTYAPRVPAQPIAIPRWPTFYTRRGGIAAYLCIGAAMAVVGLAFLRPGGSP